MRTDVYGVGFDNVTMDEALDMAYGAIRSGSRPAGWIATPNPEIVWMCRDDKKLASALEKAFLVLPDGVGIIHGARILGRPLKQRIPGIDFITELFKKMAARGESVYLLGAKPGVADKAAENLKRDYPGLEVCGTGDGYFQEDGPVVEKINAAKPDLLLVCLGAPKQEYWMMDNADRLDVPLMAGLGGSLDVFAGIVERAPEKWQKAGLEWLYRLKKEPSRFGRMCRLPLFLFAVMGQRIRGK